MKQSAIVLRKIFCSHIFMAIVFAVLLFLLNWNYFVEYIRLPLPAGSDTTGHLAVGEYYANNVFPSFWGWSHKWHTGMPIRQFYPPLFYFVTALFYKILPFSYVWIFKAFTLFLVLSVPGLVAFLSRKVSESTSAGWLSGLVAIIFLSYIGEYAYFGINLYSTFNAGLITHLLGFNLFLIWSYWFLIADSDKKAGYLSMSALFLAGLSNVHIIPLVAILFLSKLILKILLAVKNGGFFEIKRVVIKNTILVVLPVCAGAFWYVPLLANYDFVNIISLGAVDGAGMSSPWFFLKEWWIFLVMMTAGLFLSFKLKDRNVGLFSLAGMLFIIPVLLDLDKWWPSFPIATYRLVPGFCVFGAVLTGYVFAKMAKYAPTSYSRPILFTAIFGVFILIFPPGATFYERYGFYDRYDEENIAEISSYMEGRAGRFNVESYQSARELIYYLTDENHPNLSSTYIVFAESSSNATFTTALHRSLSKSPEPVPLSAKLLADEDFLNQDINVHIDRAVFMGIKYFFVSSPTMLKNFSESSKVYLEKDFGMWKLFTAKAEVKLAEVVRYEPAVLFSPLTFKSRDTNSYDYLRFQEEWFYRWRPDVVVARASSQFLDTTPDLDRFRTAIVSEYKYRDLEKAFLRLKKYAELNDLILVQSEDPLYAKLAELQPNPHLFLFPRLSAKEGDLGPLRKSIGDILEVLEKNKQSVFGWEVGAEEVQYEKNKVVVSTGRSQTKDEMPILIKTSFFPTWRREDGNGPVYMASPVFMLTYSNKDIVLDFKTPVSVYVGYCVSLITFVIVVSLAVRKTKFFMNRKHLYR